MRLVGIEDELLLSAEFLKKFAKTLNFQFIHNFIISLASSTENSMYAFLCRQVGHTSGALTP